MIYFYFDGAPVTSAIRAFAEASGRRFIVDGSVAEKVTILQRKPMTLDQAYAALSDALSLNGYAVTESGGSWIVRSARNTQRSFHAVSDQLPEIHPERIVTYVIKLKNLSGEEANRRLRILPSKDGELTPGPGNTLILTDWVSNIHRIHEVLSRIDTPEGRADWSRGQIEEPAGAKASGAPRFREER